MGRARVLEEIRAGRFEELLDRHERGHLTHAEAAEMLGASARTFGRWQGRWRAEGAEGLRDRRIGKPSSRRAASLVEEEGTASSLRGLAETIAAKGLFCALYTDRGGHYSRRAARPRAEISRSIVRAAIGFFLGFGDAPVPPLGSFGCCLPSGCFGVLLLQALVPEVSDLAFA